MGEEKEGIYREATLRVDSKNLIAIRVVFGGASQEGKFDGLFNYSTLVRPSDVEEFVRCLEDAVREMSAIIERLKGKKG
jgi:hypothetical protein